MTKRMPTAIVLLVFAQGFAGCDGRHSTPSAPSPVPQPALSGSVSDSAFRSLPGATVEVLDGPHAGTSTTSGADGLFTLTGTFDDATSFRATKEGYVPSTQPLRTIAQGRPRLIFRLAMLAPPVNIAGDYSLTFIADTTCGLPNELRSRTYAAAVTPASSPGHPVDTLFKVDVSGALLVENYKTFSIGVAGDYLGFALAEGKDWTLVEQVAANKYLAFYGSAGASVGSTISTSFDADILYCTLTSDTGRFEDCDPDHDLCYSKNHRLIFTRR